MLRALWHRAAPRLKRLAVRAGLVPREALPPLAADLAALRHRCDELGGTLAWLAARATAAEAAVATLTARLAETTAWLAAEPWHAAAPATDGPLVSVVMATRDRADCLAAAIASVVAQTYPHWELLVADDGSRDGTAAVVAGFPDRRIHYLPGLPLGVSAARNRALDAAAGEVIAYLDSDNRMAPGHLAAAVAALAASPAAPACYLAQTVLDPATGAPVFVRSPAFDRPALERANRIDLNVLVHRRSAVRFDPQLTRLNDWDVLLQLTAHAPAVRVPAIGGVYETGRGDRISACDPLGPDAYRVRRKLERADAAGLRVLYCVWHWPQVTESYMRWEAEYVRRRGADVLVWVAADRVACRFDTAIPHTAEPLPQVLRRFRPHVAHAHWLHSAREYLPAVAAAGVPLTVRGHGFDLTPELAAELLAHPTVHRVYLHPPAAARLPAHPKLWATPTGFWPDLYYPGPKDRRRVFRTACALPSKDLTLFIDLAARCPEFEFELVAGPALDREGYVGELAAYHAAAGRPARLRVGLSHEETAARMRGAGVYLHTVAPGSSVGGPISIAEAMGTGAYVLYRRDAALAEYVGDAGAAYGDIAEAEALLRATLRWTDAEWRAAERRSLERAYGRHADLIAYGPILDDWLALRAATVGGRLAA